MDWVVLGLIKAFPLYVIQKIERNYETMSLSVAINICELEFNIILHHKFRYRSLD